MVTKVPLFSRSVPILKRIHWLPVKFRIHFKICAITFRTLKENQPVYPAALLVRPKISKYLRSTNSNRFVVPRIKTKTQPYGTPCLCPYVMPKQLQHSENHLNLTSSVVRLPVDEPTLASTTTQDHACAPLSSVH